MNYRDYIIEPSPFLPGKFEYHKGEGDKVRTADSIQEAKQEIDILIFESTVWEVKVPHASPVKFTDLVDALLFCRNFNGILSKEFNAP
jgi:hypothetical protein